MLVAGEGVKKAEGSTFRECPH